MVFLCSMNFLCKVNPEGYILCALNTYLVAVGQQGRKEGFCAILNKTTVTSTPG